LPVAAGLGLVTRCKQPTCFASLTVFYKKLDKVTSLTGDKAWDFDNAGILVKRKKSLQFNELTDSIEVIS
jgi:hypothetical protein